MVEKIRRWPNWQDTWGAVVKESRWSPIKMLWCREWEKNKKSDKTNAIHFNCQGHADQCDETLWCWNTFVFISDWFCLLKAKVMRNTTGVLFLFFVVTLTDCVPIVTDVELDSYNSQISEDFYEFSWVLRCLTKTCGDKNIICWRFKLSDGQARSEKGVLSSIGNAQVYRVSGSYEFKGTDGKTYIVEYVADENGYKANMRGNYYFTSINH